MRYLFILLCFSVMPFCIKAQPSLHMGFNTGGVFSQLQYNKDMIMAFDPAELGVWMNLRVWMQGKYWQAGLSAETGMIRQRMDYVVEQYQQGQLVNTLTISSRQDIISPAVSPMLFGHIKLDIPRGGYVYAGPAFGIISGTNSVGYTHQFRSAVGGADWGISFRLNNNVRFEVGHTWRYTKIAKNTGTYYLSPPDNQGTYISYRMTDIKLNFITNTIGLSLQL